MLDGVDLSQKLPELKLPILRLRIENSGFPVIKSKRLVDHFISRIANISDFMQFYKRSGVAPGAGGATGVITHREIPGDSTILGSGIVGMDEAEN